MILGDRIPDKTLISLSACSIQGKRNHMEDYFDIGYQLKSCDQCAPDDWPYEYFYFGVFDGHGGPEAAKFAKENLLRYITEQNDFWSDDDDDIMRAIRYGYAKCHSEMRKEMFQWSRTKVLPSTAGTTASILIIRNGKFYTGHVGDSRIVVVQENNESNSWISKSLTKDHKPETPREVQRIARAGGEVRNKVGVYRVVWKRPVTYEESQLKLDGFETPNEDPSYVDKFPTYPIDESQIESYKTVPFLAIARSLGDFWSINPYSGQYIVSPEPDISCRPIDENDKCIVLASDGLWNVIYSIQVARMMQELKQSLEGDELGYNISDNFYDLPGLHGDHFAHSLVCYAYQIWERRRLKSDNITVIVALFHDLFHQALKASKPYNTRAVIQSNISIGTKFKNGLVQLGQTDSFLGKVRLDKEPIFRIDQSNQFREKWNMISDYLVLPPTIYDEQYSIQPRVVYPKNYMLLSAAECRKEPLEEDSILWIKHVTDDQADRRRTKSRMNAIGKMVRDASCQATQAIHDFGQPWDELIKIEKIKPDDNPSRDVDYKYDFDLDIGVISNIEEVDLYNPESPEIIETSAATPQSKIELSGKGDKARPQLRCLLNWTPPLRRSTRKSSLSMSESNKRKVENTPNLGKNKRRKSQPGRICSNKD